VGPFDEYRINGDELIGMSTDPKAIGSASALDQLRRIELFSKSVDFREPRPLPRVLTKVP
jgi:hypothetical protein